MINQDIRCKYCNWLNKETLIPFNCENCKKYNSEVEEIIKEEDWISELARISGIGLETIKDIKKIYSSLEELQNALQNDTVPLRNDVVKKLKTYISQKEVK